MLAQLFGFLAQFWRTLIPWYVLDSEQVGFVRRLGVPVARAKRPRTPGLHYKHPVIETLEAEDGRDYPYMLDPQSLTSKDGTDLVVRLSLTCRVVDAERYFLKVSDGRANIQDVACGELCYVAQRAAARDILSGKVLDTVLENVQKVARRWGMRVDSIKFVDDSKAPSMRLWQTSFTSAGQD
jgi:regulator of protease activity HflC (stomatin/prohibitin superfamily)